jgi:uncharacterized protein
MLHPFMHAPVIEPARTITPYPPQKPQRPRVWTVFVTWLLASFVGLVASFSAFVIVGVALGVVMGAQGLDAATIQARVTQFVQQPLLALLLSLVPFQLGILATAMLAARMSPRPLKERLGLLPVSGQPVSRLKVATMGAFTLSAALGSAIALSLVLGAPPANAISTTITDGSWLAIALMSLLLSMLPAVVEEIVFRGYIQRRLLERWSPSMAIGVSTVLFAIMHADSLQHVLAVIPLGVVTGLLAWRTGSIVPGILLHAVHNAGAVAFGAVLRFASPHLSEDATGMIVIAMVILLGLAGLPVVVSLLRTPRQDAELPAIGTVQAEPA